MNNENLTNNNKSNVMLQKMFNIVCVRFDKQIHKKDLFTI